MEKITQEESVGGWTEALGETATNPDKPRTSGDQVFSLNRWWTFSSFEARLCAQFEQWCIRNAKKAIHDAEMEDGPEEAAKMRSAFIADRGAGHYTWDGRHCRAARGDYPGIKHMVYLCLKRCNSEMTEQLASEIFEDNYKDCSTSLAWALGNLSKPKEGRKNTESNGQEMKMER